MLLFEKILKDLLENQLITLIEIIEDLYKENLLDNKEPIELPKNSKSLELNNDQNIAHILF